MHAPRNHAAWRRTRPLEALRGRVCPRVGRKRPGRAKGRIENAGRCRGHAGGMTETTVDMLARQELVKIVALLEELAGQLRGAELRAAMASTLDRYANELRGDLDRGHV